MTRTNGMTVTNDATSCRALFTHSIEETQPMTLTDPALIEALRTVRDAHTEHEQAVDEYNAAAIRLTTATERLATSMRDVRSLLATTDDPTLTA